MKTVLIPVATFHQLSIAFLVLSHLESEGIRCFLDHTTPLKECLTPSVIQLQTCQSQHKRAIDIIENFRLQFPQNSIKLTA